MEMSNWVPLRLRNLFIKFIYSDIYNEKDMKLKSLFCLLIALFFFFSFDKLDNYLIQEVFPTKNTCLRIKYILHGKELLKIHIDDNPPVCFGK